MSSFRNFTFPKKKAMDNDDATKSPHLRPFLIGLPREAALSIINSSRPAKRVSRESFIQMNVPARDRQSGLRGTTNSSCNDTKIYVPFAPQASDLESLMAPKKPGTRCSKCNANIVLTPVNKKDGEINVKNAHLGEIFNVTRGNDENGAPITVQMVWACRINRHVFPSSTPDGSTLVTPTTVAAPETAPKRLTFAGAQRWVNEMQELLRIGDVIRARECMTQIVLMNEGMKKESFTWLEKEKATRLSAALNLPKQISTFQEEEEEKAEEPGDGEKLLKEFFEEEGDTIYRMITSEESNLEYSGLAIDSDIESSRSEVITNRHDDANGELSTVQKAETAVTVTTCIRNTKENLSPDDKLAETHASSSKEIHPSSLSTDSDHPSQPDLLEKEETFTSKNPSKRFSFTNLLTGFKKASPSIKRVEGKRDLGKYAEEQAVAAAISPALLPAHGQSVSLQEMLQEPFDRITEGSLKDSPGGHRASGVQSGTPSFVTDKSENGNDSVQEIERGLTVVTITSEASGKRSVSENSTGLRRTDSSGVVDADDGSFGV